jgi:peroxiredoxin
MTSMLLQRLCVLLLLLCAAAAHGLDQLEQRRDEPPKAPRQILDRVRQSWTEASWSVPDEGGYLRPAENDGWRARTLAMRDLVLAGERSVPPLLVELRQGDGPMRIFAAQTLGFLAPHAPAQVLREAAASDPLAAVRLYAVDALGMHAKTTGRGALELCREKEENRDVKKHIAYALERGDAGVNDKTRRALIAWDPQTIDSAVVGQPAPDFELDDLGGRRIRLSSFRGKRAVVLVFIYGDTCPVCHRQLAQLRARIAAKADQMNVQLLAVDPHEKWAARYLLKEVGLTTTDVHVPLLLDAAQTVSATYGVAFQMRIHKEISKPTCNLSDRPQGHPPPRLAGREELCGPADAAGHSRGHRAVGCRPGNRSARSVRPAWPHAWLSTMQLTFQFFWTTPGTHHTRSPNLKPV